MPNSPSSEALRTHGAGATSLAPVLAGDYTKDLAAFSAFWLGGLARIAALPPRAKRNDLEQEEVVALLREARASRNVFLGAHVGKVYRDLTGNLTVLCRVEELAELAASKMPGLCPTQSCLAKESALVQSEKDGHEVDQGIFFNHVLGDEICGRHLCHAMLLPRREALDLLPQLKRDGRVDLGKAMVERKGKASIVTMKNGRYLNAEDDGTVKAVETAVDLAILDPETSICVMRGGVMESGKYKDRSVFCTGINLTHLYYGRISYLWYLIRDLGFIHKIYRGLATADSFPDDIHGESMEKPWIAAIDKFAIGGGCQYLLVMDYNIAASDAYMTLPARKEGIVPGAANLRMARFVGDRITRQAVMSERRIDCDSPEGRLICDEVVAPDDLNATVDRVILGLTSSGVVSASSNRKSFRIAQETIDQFRSYMAVYAREQAYCHFSPALIGNLERFWNAQQRTV